MKKFIKNLTVLGLVAVLILSILSGISCTTNSNNSQVEAASAAFSITDDRDTKIDFSKPVDTIISLAPSNTEIVYFVGAEDKLIGRTDYCNYPEEVSSVDSIGGFYDPNKELIITKNPDVVLATGLHVTTGDVEYLENYGLTVIVINPETVGEIMDSIEIVGKLTGNEETAQNKVAELEERIDAVTVKTSLLTDAQKPRVLHVTWHDPLWTVGTSNHMNTVIVMAGGKNIFTDVSGDVQVDSEQAVTRNPEVITVVTGHGSNVNDSFNYLKATDSPYKNTDAYKNENINLVNADLVSRASPRIVDALELVAGILHPDLFS